MIRLTVPPPNPISYRFLLFCATTEGHNRESLGDDCSAWPGHCTTYTPSSLGIAGSQVPPRCRHGWTWIGIENTMLYRRLRLMSKNIHKARPFFFLLPLCSMFNGNCCLMVKMHLLARKSHFHFFVSHSTLQALSANTSLALVHLGAVSLSAPLSVLRTVDRILAQGSIPGPPMNTTYHHEAATRAQRQAPRVNHPFGLIPNYSSSSSAPLASKTCTRARLPPKSWFWGRGGVCRLLGVGAGFIASRMMSYNCKINIKNATICRGSLI